MRAFITMVVVASGLCGAVLTGEWHAQDDREVALGSGEGRSMRKRISPCVTTHSICKPGTDNRFWADTDKNATGPVVYICSYEFSRWVR